MLFRFLGRFGLDLLAAGKRIWDFSYLSQASGWAVERFNASLGQTGAAAKLHAAGLRVATGAMKVFTAATKLGGLAMRALPLVGMVTLIWDLVSAFGKWMYQFTPVQKFLAGFEYSLKATWLQAKRLWATLTGGDVKGDRHDPRKHRNGNPRFPYLIHKAEK